MKDHYRPALLLACACLVVATAITASEVMRTPVTHQHETMTIDAETIVFYVSDTAYAEREPEAVVKPVSDALAGPGKRCSQGAWFAARPLEQGSGNVRGFCP